MAGRFDVAFAVSGASRAHHGRSTQCSRAANAPPRGSAPREVGQEAARQADRSEAVKLLIRADRNADTTHLNRVVTRLKDLGVGLARIATEVPR